MLDYTEPGLVGLTTLRRDVLPSFVRPVPTAETLMKWFSRANIAEFYVNREAKRGEGPPYFRKSDAIFVVQTRIAADRQKAAGKAASIKTVGLCPCPTH